jgi:signal transduction histidine kinase
VDLVQTLGAMVSMYQDQARGRDVSLELDLPPGLPPALGHPRLYDDILNNLIGNAVKYTPSGGRVTVSLRREEPGWLTLRVEDTGIGIPPESLASLGQEIHRAANAQAHTEEGTGLGLIIVKDILERLGGTMKVGSQVGQGSIFACRLPAAE